MKHLFVTLILAFAFIYEAKSQQVVPTGCNYTVQSNFNVSAYAGQWFEIEASNHIEEIGGICIEANYSLFPNGSVEVLNKQIMESTGEWYEMLGNARLLDSNSTDAKLLVSFPSVGAYDAPYWVLESDYNRYSLVLSCRPYGNGNSIQTLWFLARQRSPIPALRDYVRNKIAELQLNLYLTMKTTVQENCPENK